MHLLESEQIDIFPTFCAVLCALGKLHYIQLRRAMEDILQLASQRYEVRCHIYRHPDTVSLALKRMDRGHR